MAPLMIAVENRMQELFSYAGARERSPRDRWVGVTTAVVFHAALLFIAGQAFSQSARYGVEAGTGSLEIALVAAPVAVMPAATVPAPEPVVQAMAEPDAPEIAMIQPEAQPVPVSPAAQEAPQRNAAVSDVVGDGSSAVPGKDATTFYSEGGALVEASPAYLRNPAPAYPEAARRRGEEGLVLLLVNVDRGGRAVEVAVKKDSGFSALDKAAVKAVRRWRFQPAQLGSLAVDSKVEVPIRFTLDAK